MKTLRAIADKTGRDRIRNDEMKDMTGITSIKSKIEKAPLRWLRHMEGVVKRELQEKMELDTRR